jgi:hypothetical protein
VDWVAGTVVTERESGDGDGRRVEGRRRSRVRRHEVQSIAVTAEGRSRKMRRQCCCSCEELYWWKQYWLVILSPVLHIQCKMIRMGTSLSLQDARRAATSPPLAQQAASRSADRPEFVAGVSSESLYPLVPATSPPQSIENAPRCLPPIIISRPRRPWVL